MKGARNKPDDMEDDPVKDELDRIPQLESWETILFSTPPHAKSFLRMWVSYVFLTILWALALVVSAFSVPIDNRLFWWSFIAVSIAMASFGYGYSRGMLGRNKPMLYACNFWVAAFIFLIGALLMQMIHTELAATQEQWWERFIGIPFSLASIVFSILVFVISRVVWRIGVLTPKLYSFPFYASSIMLVVISLYSLIFARQFALLTTSEMLQYLFMVFSGITIAYGLLLVSFITHRGGIRYVMTTKRMIIYTNFLRHSVEDHMFDKVHDIELSQSFFGRRYNYGDLKVRLLLVMQTSRGDIIHKHTFPLYGVPSPILMKNTIMALLIGAGVDRTADRMNVNALPINTTPTIPQIIITQEFTPANTTMVTLLSSGQALSPAVDTASQRSENRDEAIRQPPIKPTIKQQKPMEIHSDGSYTSCNRSNKIQQKFTKSKRKDIAGGEKNVDIGLSQTDSERDITQRETRVVPSRKQDSGIRNMESRDAIDRSKQSRRSAVGKKRSASQRSVSQSEPDNEGNGKT